MGFLKRVGMHDPNVENYSSRDFYSNLLCNTLKTHTVRRGHVTCFATVTPAVANYFGGLHGGAVAAIAERVAIATTRTVVGEDKEIFLVDLGMSYLSAAPKDVSSFGFLISHFCYVEKDLAGKDRIICMESWGDCNLQPLPWDVHKPSFNMQAELIVDGAVVKSGRNITAVSIEFKMKKTGKLLFTSRATFHNSPLAKL
ncbi:hypothetical protein Goklo_014218 [Gossypium klotzschianum]|uniref:Thioesterase domain-containing protein n=1 Tax=Gossypium klotzschianum TaxID=34286 RepID=A0A7J8U7D5_9ROSI|nr:hypothetical protein [Gossypium klotzschianum]